MHTGPQERNVFRIAHLARSHGELAMMKRSIACGAAVDFHVVRSIRQDNCGPTLAHQNPVRLIVERVAAQYPVLAREPQIARFADWCSVQDWFEEFIFLL